MSQDRASVHSKNWIIGSPHNQAGTIIAMLYRGFCRLVRFAAIFGLAVSLSVFAQNSTRRGRKYKAPPPNALLEVTVLRSDDGKPIENAAVVFQLEREKGNMELKTNEEGKAVIDVLPQGAHVVVQVLAKGYQTYGGEYTLDKPQQSIELKMNRPGRQYSIYEKHNQEPKPPQSSDAGKSINNTKSGDKKDPNSKDSEKKSDDSAKQSDSKPDSSPSQPH